MADRKADRKKTRFSADDINGRGGAVSFATEAINEGIQAQQQILTNTEKPEPPTPTTPAKPEEIIQTVPTQTQVPVQEEISIQKEEKKEPVKALNFDVPISMLKRMQSMRYDKNTSLKALCLQAVTEFIDKNGY